jgi:septal ring factor EnvC (AmiA/AmiB activator)
VKHIALVTAMALGLGALVVAPPVPARADAGSGAGAAAAMDPVSADWSARLAKAHAKLEAARTQVVSAQAALDRARNRQYPTGAPLAKLEQDLADAKQTLATREAEWPQLLEEARRAGVLAEVLRPYEN